ncbi:toxic anion resistance protein [Acetobacterium tundrae]|uniref:Toxic anion resistance protein n=1 Tax=Acetobacterium tundrae TaxID=132932 RepID=A0ABR6WGS3_9FIRM|nr:toxic anion resistance protein [Acetobacterium tundrae]MBC3795682.1 toxic anion resistance protein [Acetobacterium tundrae]
MDDGLKDFDQVTPTLTFDPFDEGKSPVVNQKNQMATEDKIFDEARLSPEEQKMVNEFAEKIDLSNSALIMQYGVGAQKKIAEFSETALSNVRTKDLGEVGKMLGDMVSELRNFESAEEEKGFFGFFKKNANKISSMQVKYAAAETNINRICESLEKHQVQLMKDVAMMDKLYEVNKTYFKELSMYILAGKKKIQLIQSTDLPALIQKSQMSGLPEDAQAVNDFSAMANRFEKKLHDLELTRLISIQMAPQIRLVQNNDTLMAEKIQSSIVNTIPLWKSQMVLALGVAHSGEAARAQRQVTDMTNQLLRKNAETLKMETINTAKESERGIVDIETLKITNESLITTFDEVLKIQDEGRQKRKSAEAELQKLENDLKLKMLEIRR